VKARTALQLHLFNLQKNEIMGTEEEKKLNNDGKRGMRRRGGGEIEK
jgi:hypothetical protein